MKNCRHLGQKSGGLVDKNAITIAIPKGRLLGECLDLFGRVNLKVSGGVDTSRKLLFPSENSAARFFVVRDKDIPTYVEYGAADMGIVGKDVLLEAGKDLLEPLDLGFGFCRIVVAEPSFGTQQRNSSGWGHPQVATKYPKIAGDFFASRGEHVEIISLYGAIELAPLTALADRIVDLVSTGETLRQNNLVEVEEVAQITARLVVNRASLRTRSEQLVKLIEEIRVILEK
ncbi:ATP phosphoribosyltransferase [bacterium]|nr:MAG: ATP phosphoribosyltransferase [bacterium]